MVKEKSKPHAKCDKSEYKTRCDLCGEQFLATHCLERTCQVCRLAGAPSQADRTWVQYQEDLKAWQRANGKRAPISGQALIWQAKRDRANAIRMPDVKMDLAR